MTRDRKMQRATEVEPRRALPFQRSAAADPRSPARALQEVFGNHAAQQFIARLQRKPTVSAPDDPLERQADAVADQVMRACKDCEEEKKEERPRIHRVASTMSTVADADVGAAVSATQKSGAALPADVRSFFEPRFGHDFSDVRVHTGDEAAHAARGAQARAYTIGRDIVFGAHEYAPGTDDGRRLLAHELAHVVQQGSAEPSVQRRILIGGTPYTPDAGYNSYLKKNFGDAMVEFIASMHNGGKPPDFSFDSNEQMGREVRVRAAAIKGMEKVHQGCCSYATGGGDGKLNAVYWDKKGPYQFTLKVGKKPSEGIEAIFKSGAETELECNSMMVAIQYRAMLTMLGSAAFDKKFAGGAGLIISPHHQPPSGVALHPIWDKNLYKEVTISGAKDLLPGDWVYFKNVADYGAKHPGGFWTGEHTMYLGNGKFRGFGIAEESEGDVNKKLLDEYNTGLPKADQVKSVPGLQNYARRPVISEVEKAGP